MKRKDLEKLAKALACVRGELSHQAYETLILRVGEVCADNNPAFDLRRFRETATAQHFVGGQKSTQARSPEDS